MRKIVFPLAVAAVITGVGLIACQKETSADDTAGGNRTFKVRLTDAPIDADEVNVDIQQVRVNLNDDTSGSGGGWVNLNTNAGIYNLLGLQNGVDTLLASGVLPSNTVKEIRFILGTNNTIMVDSVVYPLSIPSGAESGLKLKINKTITGTVDSILIDFDAALSVHQTGAGDYKLRPVLKIK